MWKINVISLPDAVDRRARIQKSLSDAGLEFEFRMGVDGRTLEDREIALVYDATRNAKLFKRHLSLPEIGCYLSHYREWRRLAESDDEGCFILEDDAEFDGDLADVLNFISNQNLGGHIVKLDASGKMRTRRTIHRLPGKRSMVEPRVLPARTTGYGLTRKAAQNLVGGALPFFRPVDLDLKHWWERGVTPLAILPAPIKPHPCESSIANARESSGPKSIISRLWRNCLYQYRFHTGLFKARVAVRRRDTVVNLDPPASNPST